MTNNGTGLLRERERKRTVLCAYTIRMKLTLCSMRGESERIDEIYLFCVPVFWKRWWLLSFLIFYCEMVLI